MKLHLTVENFLYTSVWSWQWTLYCGQEMLLSVWNFLEFWSIAFGNAHFRCVLNYKCFAYLEVKDFYKYSSNFITFNFIKTYTLEPTAFCPFHNL